MISWNPSSCNTCGGRDLLEAALAFWPYEHVGQFGVPVTEMKAMPAEAPRVGRMRGGDGHPGLRQSVVEVQGPGRCCDGLGSGELFVELGHGGREGLLAGVRVVQLLDRSCRLERRSCSLNQVMASSLSTINPFRLVPHAD
jgi:hypothetical protein